MMKIYTLWSREGCDTDEAPWLLAATDEVSILENNGYPEAFQAAVTRHPAARLLILEVPAAALKLWHTPTVQVQPVSDLEQLATKLGIKEVSRAALEAEREALRQRFRTEFGLTTDRRGSATDPGSRGAQCRVETCLGHRILTPTLAAPCRWRRPCPTPPPSA